jgi:hypothetical protein
MAAVADGEDGGASIGTEDGAEKRSHASSLRESRQSRRSCIGGTGISEKIRRLSLGSATVARACNFRLVQASE